LGSTLVCEPQSLSDKYVEDQQRNRNTAKARSDIRRIEHVRPERTQVLSQ
jgi:hypothetical protein